MKNKKKSVVTKSVLAFALSAALLISQSVTGLAVYSTDIMPDGSRITLTC